MKLADVLEFLEPPVSISWNLPPAAAIRYLQDKGLQQTFSYADLINEEHAAAFTVAKMMDTDLLADIRASLEEALASGKPYGEWVDSIIPTLQAKGWWGRAAVTDPLTGETIMAPVGSPARLATIFRTNMQSAYAVGQWQQIAAQEDAAPYLLYDAVDDFRTRPLHAAWDGLVLPVGHKFWHDHYPPNGWNCRCSVIQLSKDDLDELGLKVSRAPEAATYEWKNPRTGKIEKIPLGIDPGFQFNPGQKRIDELAKLAIEKARALPADAAAAALKGLDAAELAAQAAIDKALADNAPYLASAIKEVQKLKSTQGLKASDVLAAAQEKAIKKEASASLKTYKDQVLAGKVPSGKAQAAFDALPEEAQQALTDQLTAQIAETKLQAAAQAELAALAANPNSVGAKAIKKLAAEGKKPAELLAEVKAEVQAQSAKISQAMGLSGYKKAAIAGKTPTAAQKAAFDGAGDDVKAKLLAEIDQAKAAAAKKVEPPAGTTAGIPQQVEAAPTGLNPSALVQVGSQGGSNPGGLFQDTETGVKWYLKWPSEEMLRNEMLANRLYAAAGVEVPEVRIIQFNGRPTIASRVIEGLELDAAALRAGRVTGVQEHFAVDAWLANWDVVGLSFDNLKLLGGRGIRIDPGGSLRFRAQGGLKGAQWSDEVLDIDSLRNAGTNSQAASVFKHVTKADIEDGVRRILSIPEEKIRALVDEFGPLDRREREAMLARLLARRADLAKKYPNAVPQEPAPLPPVKRVTRAEQVEIQASRANGYTMPTDGREIEDHHVVVMHYTDAKGKPRTRAVLKLRPEAAAKLQASAGDAAGAASFDLSSQKDKLLTVLKSVNARAKKGDIIPQHTFDNFESLQAMLKAKSTELEGLGKQGLLIEDAENELRRLTELTKRLAAYFRANPVGSQARPTGQYFLDTIASVTPLRRANSVASSGLKWTAEQRLTYQAANIVRGRVEETDRTLSMNLRTLRTRLGDDEVRFVPDSGTNFLSSRGYMQIDLDGQGEEVTERLFQRLDELGIDSRRAGAVDRLELYLDRHLYVRTLRDSANERAWRELDDITDQAQRTERKLELLNKIAGFDVRTSANWNPDGGYQAFGHGRLVTYRSDFDTKEFAAFQKKYVLYHNPVSLGSDGGGSTFDRFKLLVEAGGQLASQMDRVRRGIGIGGSSPDADLRSGGANYIFTRIFSRTRKAGTGFYFKPRMVARTDSFSYSHDAFGNANLDYQRQHRATTLAEMAANSKGSGNETMFRDAVSLFDDVEHIVLEDSQVAAAIKFMRDNGYDRWPDGRALEEVIIGRSRSPYG